MLIYSKPDTERIIEDYPLGGSRRGRCRFGIETDAKRGKRAYRITTGKPKYSTYHRDIRIVDGDDGRTYIVCLHFGYTFVSVYKSDFMSQETVHADQAERHAELMKLFEDDTHALMTHCPLILQFVAIGGELDNRRCSGEFNTVESAKQHCTEPTLTVYQKTAKGWKAVYDRRAVQ